MSRFFPLLLSYQLVAAANPVRDLQCVYDILKEHPLSCTWREPEHAFATIQSYQVNVYHEGSIMSTHSTKSLLFQTKDKLIQGGGYVVSVSTITNNEEAVAETIVKFANYGMSFDCLLMLLSFSTVLINTP